MVLVEEKTCQRNVEISKKKWLRNTFTGTQQFLRAAAMQARNSPEPDVCPSVCPSVKHADCEKNERNFRPHSYTTGKIIHSSFLTGRMIGRRQPLLPEILGRTDPVGEKAPIFNRYFHLAPQP